MVTVPDVIGDTQAQAQSALQAAGLASAVMAQPACPPGIVEDQGPDGLGGGGASDAGQSVPAGTTIDIVVNLPQGSCETLQSG